MNSRVADKIALVTGAGRGIGRAIAMALAREGATVYATDILAAEIEETAELIRGAGGIVTAIVHDVLEPDARSGVRSMRFQVGQRIVFQLIRRCSIALIL